MNPPNSPLFEGKLVARPNPLPADNSPLTLSWSCSGGGAQLWVAEESVPEKFIARGQQGALELGWVQAGRTYTFRIYAEDASRQLLDEVAVRRSIEGKLCLVEGADSSQDSTVLRWSITPPVVAEVCLAQTDETERIAIRGESGEFSLQHLPGGKPYLFRLYAATPRRPLLDEITFVRRVCGSLTVAPDSNPLSGAANLQWTITEPTTGEITLSEERGSERVVCRGRSGTSQVAGLKTNTNYQLRLYAFESRELLAETSLRTPEIPWDQLLARLNSSGGKEFGDGLANFLATVLPVCLRRPDFSTWFKLWEESGVHVTPVHFYQPIPDTRTLRDELWEKPLELAGLDLNEASQLHFLREVFSKFKKEYDDIPLQRAASDSMFHLHNNRFDGIDALIAYCMVRHFQPGQIVEVGSGYSTLLLAQAALRNGHTRLESVEPYPEAFLTRGIAGLSALREEKVENIPLSYFTDLKAGDFLFIDTSHVVRIGGDVNHLFLKVLPSLREGVVVHLHDIFFPFEYPREWVMNQRRFWTEQYLLQAFLTYNTAFEVLVSSAFLKDRASTELEKIFPTAEPWHGGSFWMRRKLTAP